MIQLVIMDEVPLGLARQALVFVFVVRYRSEPEVLGDRFLLVYVEVGQPSKDHYFHPGLLSLTNWPG
jgi:hypothetical protein